MSVWKL
jgi:ribonuclease HI